MLLPTNWYGMEEGLRQVVMEDGRVKKKKAVYPGAGEKRSFCYCCCWFFFWQHGRCSKCFYRYNFYPIVFCLSCNACYLPFLTVSIRLLKLFKGWNEMNVCILARVLLYCLRRAYPSLYILCCFLQLFFVRVFFLDSFSSVLDIGLMLLRRFVYSLSLYIAM